MSLPSYFALARGSRDTGAERAAGIEYDLCRAGNDQKWFGTNFHYLVPRLVSGQQFELTENRPLERMPGGIGLYTDATSASPEPSLPVAGENHPAQGRPTMAPIRWTCSTACCRSTA